MPVDSQHKSYKAHVSQWQRCRDVHDGSDAIKARGVQYLPMLDGQREKPERYESYKLRALFYNGMSRTVSGLTGAVFRKDPVTKTPAVIKSHLEDITLSRTPFVSFAMRVLEETIKVGRYGVMVEFSDTKNRPYWVPYIAENIINWRAVNVGGESVLTRVVLRECANETDPQDAFTTKEVEQYRVLELVVGVGDAAVLATSDTMRSAYYRVRVYRKNDKGDWAVFGGDTIPKRRAESLQFIPFQFFGPASLGSDVEKPPLLDLADVNLSHYRSSADLEHGRHFCGLPTPWASGVQAGTTLAIGSGTAWTLEDANARAGYLEFSGQGLGPLKDALADKESKMATLGARLLEASKAGGEADTATAVRMRHSGEHAVLKVIASTAQMGVESLLRVHAWWMGAALRIEEATALVEVALNNEFFDIQVTPDELRTLMLLWQSGGMSFETFYWNLTRGGVTRPGVTVDAERKLVEAESADRLDAAAEAMANVGGGDPAENDDPNKQDGANKDSKVKAAA
jgi:hypothetical protein